jgi:hypothetical protein
MAVQQQFLESLAGPSPRERKQLGARDPVENNGSPGTDPERIAVEDVNDDYRTTHIRPLLLVK